MTKVVKNSLSFPRSFFSSLLLATWWFLISHQDRKGKTETDRELERQMERDRQDRQRERDRETKRQRQRNRDRQRNYFRPNKKLYCLQYLGCGSLSPARMKKTCSSDTFPPRLFVLLVLLQLLSSSVTAHGKSCSLPTSGEWPTSAQGPRHGRRAPSLLGPGLPCPFGSVPKGRLTSPSLGLASPSGPWWGQTQTCRVIYPLTSALRIWRCGGTETSLPRRCTCTRKARTCRKSKW